MAIDIMLSSALRPYVPDYDPLKGMHIEAEPGLTVEALIKSLNIPPKDVKIIMINGKSDRIDSPLSDGDRVGLFPAVGGG